MKYDVSIIYVYYNTPRELSDSIRSVMRTCNKIKYQIIVVNNASPKKIPYTVLKNKKVLIVNSLNEGYGAGLNKGVEYSKSSNLILVNPDTIFLEEAIQKLTNKIRQKDIGVVGPMMLSTKGEVLPTISGKASLKSIIYTTSFLNTLFPNNSESRKFWLKDLDRNLEQKVDVVSGACIAIKKKVFEKVGGFDTRFFMYYEETDFCMRVKRLGLSICYYPKAKIIHKIGASSRNKELIEKKFQESRFKFIKKYNGKMKALFAELFLRGTTTDSLSLSVIILISIFLNLYKISERMLFIGDFGRDYLVARDMLILHKIPLVGIPSSVVWLHQGPLSIYFIAFSLWIGKFNPVAPAIFYSILGVLTTILVYKLGKLLFNKKIGLIAGLFYSTSPLIVLSARMPYHTSSIPLFVCIFFLLLYKIVKGNKKLLPLWAFVFGLLMLLELSNAVLLLVSLAIFFIFKTKIDSKKIILTICSFLLGISPFILYDLSHRFVQTIGFPLWVINRLRLFLGITTQSNSTSHQIFEAVGRVLQQLSGLIFPAYFPLAALLITVSVLFVLFNAKTLRKNKESGLLVVLLWLFIPLIAYLIHTAPGVAYFPLLFPTVALFMAFVFYRLFIRFKFLFILFVAMCLFNFIYILNNDYFLNTKSGPHFLGSGSYSYSYGTASSIQDEAAIAITKDANGRKFMLESGGFMKTLKTGLDNYTYLIWYRGGKISKASNLRYVIFEDKNSVPSNQKLFFDNGVLYIIKNEIN